MCYNLATKCVICGEFIDSKVMKCLAREVYLSIDGIWIRGCEAGNTVDGWPFFNQCRLRSPIITCPNGGTLRLHGVRVVDALCYTCKFLVPEYENPEHEDYLGERCGNVYQADFERNVYYRIGSYLLLGSKVVTKVPGDQANYFVLFTPRQLEDWNDGRRKRIDASQEYIQEDVFPYAASTIDNSYCAGTTLEQHVISERDLWPLTKLESTVASWLPQPALTALPQNRKRDAADMDRADPQMRIPPVVPSPPVPQTAPQLQDSGDVLEPIPRRVSWESGQNAPTTVSYNNSQQNSARLSQLTTPPTPWLDEEDTIPSTLFPEVPAERARVAVTAAGGYDTVAASVNAEAQAHGIPLPASMQTSGNTRENTAGVEANTVNHRRTGDANDIEVHAMVRNQQATFFSNNQLNGMVGGLLNGMFPELANVAPVAFTATAAEQNAMLTYEHTVAGQAAVDTNDANGVQRATVHMGGGTVAAPALFSGANADSFFEDAMRLNQQPVESNDEAWRWMTTLSPGAGDGAFDDQTFL